MTSGNSAGTEKLTWGYEIEYLAPKDRLPQPVQLMDGTETDFYLSQVAKGMWRPNRNHGFRHYGLRRCACNTEAGQAKCPICQVFPHEYRRLYPDFIPYADLRVEHPHLGVIASSPYPRLGYINFALADTPSLHTDPTHIGVKLSSDIQTEKYGTSVPPEHRLSFNRIVDTTGMGPQSPMADWVVHIGYKESRMNLLRAKKVVTVMSLLEYPFLFARLVPTPTLMLRRFTGKADDMISTSIFADLMAHARMRVRRNENMDSIQEYVNERLMKDFLKETGLLGFEGPLGQFITAVWNSPTIEYLAEGTRPENGVQSCFSIKLRPETDPVLNSPSYGRFSTFEYRYAPVNPNNAVNWCWLGLYVYISRVGLLDAEEYREIIKVIMEYREEMIRNPGCWKNAGRVFTALGMSKSMTKWWADHLFF